MTRDDLVAEIGRLLGDPSGTTWSATTIISRLDAAQIDVQKYARAIKTTATYTPTANSPYVTISDNLIDIVNATFTLSDGTIIGEKKGFSPTSLWELNFNRPNWQNESPGTPQCWFLDASNKRIVLVPAPDASAANANALTLIEVRQPTTLSSGTGTSVPFDSNALFVPFHRALAYWVVAECLRDLQTPESLNKAKYFRSDDRQNPGLYETELRQIMSLFDVPEVQPTTVRYQKQGGRLAGPYQSSPKSVPLYGPYWGW